MFVTTAFLLLSRSGQPRLVPLVVTAAAVTASVGLILTAGLDLVSSERFTFGFTHLWGGIDILPLIIGLFAIAGMLRVLLSDGRRDTTADLTFQGCGLG